MYRTIVVLYGRERTPRREAEKVFMEYFPWMLTAPDGTRPPSDAVRWISLLVHQHLRPQPSLRAKNVLREGMYLKESRRYDGTPPLGGSFCVVLDNRTGPATVSGYYRYEAGKRVLSGDPVASEWDIPVDWSLHWQAIEAIEWLLND